MRYSFAISRYHFRNHKQYLLALNHCKYSHIKELHLFAEQLFSAFLKYAYFGRDLFNFCDFVVS